MSLLTEVLSAIAARLRGEPFELDPRVSDGRLLGEMARQCFRFIRGSIVFRARPGIVAIGSGVTFRSTSKIRFTGPLFVDDRVYIDAESVSGVVAGRNVSIQKNVTIICSGSLRHLGVGLRLGNNVGIGSHCLLGCAGGVIIEDDTILGNFVSLHSENHNFSSREVPIRCQGVSHEGIRIGKGCWIGAKATILDGAVLQEGVVIAAGAVLPKGIYESFGIYGGVPARRIGTRPAAASHQVAEKSE